MNVWVDADACPKAIKQVLFKAAERLQISMTLVANQYIPTPPSKVIKSLQVAQGFDVADNAIVDAVAQGDLVITADIPLAAEVVAKGATALNPRGTVYTKENVRDYLQRRNRAEELRATGMISGGPAALDKKDVQAFANALDRTLALGLKRP
ncbi:MAG: YaiI/YqxD family protein [Pseudomonadales bacterium]|nr:YaiI/YqxD family protein [Pseudomonadales bacterium]